MRTVINFFITFIGVGFIFAAPPAPQGVITGRAYTGISGTSVANLTNSAKFINNQPDVVVYLPYFEWNATGDIYQAPGNWGDMYGAQIVGYFYPPATGQYEFWICSDDNSVLYLSTDDNPANRKLIATEPSWNNARDYEGTARRNATNPENWSATYLGTEWPEKDPVMGGAIISLQKGRPYYIEALMKEGGGGDNLSVAVFDYSMTIPSMPGSLIPIPGEYLATIDKNSGPVVITKDPEDITVNEGQMVVFTVEVDGTPPYTYQWYRNDVPIEGATNATYSIERVSAEDNGAKFKVTVTNSLGSKTSKAATLTVISDTTPPTVVDIGSDFPTSVFIVFSEPVEKTSAENTSNYQIVGGPTVTKANLQADGKTVRLGVGQAMPEGQWFTLRINNVKDLSSAGNTIASNTEVKFKSAVFASGIAIRKKYNGFDDNSGTNPTNLFNDPRFPDKPDRIDLLRAIEYPPNGATRDSAVDPTRNYFDTIEAYFIPPTTGNYVFFTAGADRWWLYLSTDENPANIYMVAAEPGGWTDPRAWLSTHDQDPARHRSDQSPFNQWPTAPRINLTAGKKYYLLMIHHDPSWAGGDWFAATFKLEGEPDPADGSIPTLTGTVIGYYIDATASEISITKQPVSATVEEGSTAKLSILAVGKSRYGNTVFYQWQRAAPGTDVFIDIPGATLPDYETPPLYVGDSGIKYRVICTVPGLSTTSAVATVTVVSDIFGPNVKGVGSVIRNNSVEIGIEFDEDVDPVTASDAANYSLSKGTITGVRYQRFAHAGGASKMVRGTTGPFYGCGVVLTTSGINPGDEITVTVRNIKDVKGNEMTTSQSRTIKVTSKLRWAPIGGNDYLEGNTGGMNIIPDPNLWPDDVIAVGPGDFYLISSSSANWDYYDEATFVYEEVVGDFDKVVRIEYQDPSSHWARAGLCVTPATDEGVNRAAIAAGAQMERRGLVRANPNIRWDGATGNNSFEAAVRMTKGGTYTATGLGVPAYPNAWVRIKRSGQNFSAYYSNDGINWTQIATVSFATQPMPDKLLVGPYYAPELNNNRAAEGIGHSTIARFRDYGDFRIAPPNVSIGLTQEGRIIINFEGVLQVSDNVTGPYVDLTNQTPVIITPTEGKKFYRARW